ncbi:MAG: nicotinate-nucleotide diphosphorylase (carboxylating), partial [Gemmatimonadota bacterium]
MPPRATWVWLVDAALAEDLGPGDATSESLIFSELRGEAQIEAREPVVLAGMEVAREVFARHDVAWEPMHLDGARCEGRVASVHGSMRGILAA